MPHVWKKEKSKMADINRKYIWNNIYISASIHDINEIPTAVPMFSTSGNTINLLQRMLDVRKKEKSKMAAKQRDKFDYWSMFGTARGTHLKDGSMTHCIFSQMKLCLVYLLSLFVDPTFGYIIWFRERPTHMSYCVRA